MIKPTGGGGVSPRFLSLSEVLLNGSLSVVQWYVYCNCTYFAHEKMGPCP